VVRGIERTTSFRDDPDRADVLARLTGSVERGAVTVYAWALLPNHAPLWLRTGTRPLAQSMRSRLTGHAGAFNRRDKRKEAVAGDARVLGGSTFVERLWREVAPPRPQGPRLPSPRSSRAPAGRRESPRRNWLAEGAARTSRAPAMGSPICGWGSSVSRAVG